MPEVKLLEMERGKAMDEEDEDREDEPEGGGWVSLSVGEGGSELYGLELKLESWGGWLVYGELEGSWGRPDLGYAHGAGSGGVSDFTSNLRRSKSFRYSMARGLGGREEIGRDGEDILMPVGASMGFSCRQDRWKIRSCGSVRLIDSSRRDGRK